MINKKNDEWDIESTFDTHYINIANKNKSRGLTIGLEHEFFLLKSNNKPADINDSQNFLKLFAKKSHWRITEKKHGYITMLGRDCKNGSYNSLKYEYPPHLMEIAFGYSTDLHTLHEIVSDFFNIAKIIAKQVGLKLNNLPYRNDIIPNLKLLKNIESNQYNLHKSRKIIAHNKNISDINIIEFPSYTASTQVHIGGFNFVNNDVLKNLYTIEPITNYLSLKNFIDSSSVFKNRWKNYTKLFGDTSLFLFPQTEGWGYKQWRDHLINEYLKIKNINLDIIEFVESARDLQIIKPKIYGTIEFRSSPAQPDIKNIMNLAAMKLAQSILSLEGFFFNYTEEASKVWNRIILDPTLYETYILKFNKKLKKIFSNRKLGEEIYLLDR